MQLMKYLGLVGLAIFIYIVYATGLDTIIASFAGLDLFYFSLALLVLVPSVLIKAWKQGILVKALGGKLGLLENARIWLIGFFFSIITPGRSGNLLKAFYFADRAGISAGRGLAASVVERVFDVAFLFVFGLLGLLALSLSLFLDLDFTFIIAVLVIFAAFIVFALLFTKKSFVLMFAKPLFKFLVPKKFKEKLKEGFHEFYQGVGIYKKDFGLLIKVGLITLLSWVVVITHYYFLALALQIDVSFLFLFAVMPIVLLLSTLPIAFSGIGTREAALLYFLNYNPVAVSFSILIFFFNLVLGAAGFVFLNRGKKVEF